MEVCEAQYLFVCWIKASPINQGIFGFAVFVQAFALLVLIYTVSDIKYQFRITSAPLSLWHWTFVICSIIGCGTLATDIWFAHQWLLPQFLGSQAIWQAAFGAVFLLLVLCWIWFAYLRPPTYSSWNYLRYARALYRYILRGSEIELPIVADELRRSAKAITIAATQPNTKDGTRSKKMRQVADEILLLIGTRKFCRHVVASSPATAMAFFNAMNEIKKYPPSISQFASNVAIEAIRHKDSILYHEDKGYYSGMLGYIKPFSTALFGNFDLVEALTKTKSPLEIDYYTRMEWDAEQLEVYCRAVALTIENYVENENWGRHSYALFRAFSSLEHLCSGISKLDGISAGWEATLEYRRLRVLLDFVGNVITILDKHNLVSYKLRHRDQDIGRPLDLYDLVAKLIFEVILAAGYIKGPPDLCWWVQHNCIWESVFSFHGTRAHKIVQFKVRRLLYDEILRLQNFPNFRSSRILGFCLSVLGLRIGSRQGIDRSDHALRNVVVNWTKKYYLSLRAAQPFVAETCLLGSISFDDDGTRLIKTFARGLELVPRTVSLQLDPADEKKIKPRGR